MKRLLMVAFYFPPLGGAGTQRPAKLVKLAPSFGWSPMVVSVRSMRKLVRDPSLMADIPEGTPVKRVFAPSCSHLLDPLRWMGLSQLANLGTDLIPVDPELVFVPRARAGAVSLMKEYGRPEVVWTTSAPFSSHLVGMALKARYGIPWVADLRDPWTSNVHLSRFDESSRLRAWRKSRDMALEKRVYEDADLVTVTSSALRAHLIETFGVPANRVLLVRNGFDESDFDGFEQKTTLVDGQNSDNKPFRFLYAGTIYGKYDIQGFIESLESYLSNTNTPCEFHIFSKSSRRFDDILKAFPRVREITTINGYISHASLMKAYEESHAVVVRCPQELAVAGKVYELLRAKRPILALSEDAMEMTRIVKECGAGLCVDPMDIPAGRQVIEQLVAQWQTGNVLPDYDPHRVQTYSRRAQYTHLFKRLDEMIARP
ncbi:MAG: glycosyltransferase [Myxococcota bacterium]|nr:glycosyltransferase [Myxococcota bacterium]